MLGPVGRVLILSTGAMLLCSLGCMPRASTKAPVLASTASQQPEAIARAQPEKAQPRAPTPAAPEALYCEGQSWSGGHLPNPFARYYATFQGIVALGGERAALHSEIEYKDADGTNVQVFSGKHSWPWQGRSEEPYVFRYQGQPYNLDHLDVQGRSLELQFFFPQAWASLLEPARAAQQTSQSPFAFKIHETQLDAQGKLARLGIELPDEILGSRRVEMSWSESASGLRQVQVFEDDKITLAAQCRPLSKAEITFRSPPPEDAQAWQRVSRPSSQALAKLELEELGKKLFAVKFPASDCQSIVLQQKDGVSIFEAPVSPKHSERLLAKIKERLGEVKVKRVFVTHHHPAHAGGVATYVQAGIPVVTTAQNAEYFSQVIRSWRNAQPSAKQRAPRPMNFEVVPKQAHFGPPGQGVLALNIGEVSGHTDEHLVFYLEAQNLVFNGDLFYVEKGQVAPKPGGIRAKGLHQALSQAGFVNDETRIVAAWPIRDAKAVVSWKELESAAKAR